MGCAHWVLGRWDEHLMEVRTMRQKTVFHPETFERIFGEEDEHEKHNRMEGLF